MGPILTKRPRWDLYSQRDPDGTHTHKETQMGPILTKRPRWDPYSQRDPDREFESPSETFFTLGLRNIFGVSTAATVLEPSSAVNSMEVRFGSSRYSRLCARRALEVCCSTSSYAPHHTVRGHCVAMLCVHCTHTHTCTHALLTRVHWDRIHYLIGGCEQSRTIVHPLLVVRASSWSSACVRACSKCHSCSGRQVSSMLAGQSYSVSEEMRGRGVGKGKGEGRKPITLCYSISGIGCSRCKSTLNGTNRCAGKGDYDWAQPL